MARSVMKLKQLIGAQARRRVRPSFVIAELHFVDTGGKSLANRAGLAAQKHIVLNVFQ